jgi:iron-sulfur cluster assembly accessory protein
MPLLEVTDEAISYILTKVTENMDTIRICVVPGGCNGWEYDILFDKYQDGDSAIDFGKFRIVIHPNSVERLKGSTLTYERKNAFHESLIIVNPNETAHCGCGVSVSF